MEALGESTVDELTRVDFFTSHEGLNLHYESAQTRDRPAPRGLLRPHDAHAVDWRAHARARRRARRVLPRHREPRRREARPEGDPRRRCRASSTRLNPDERAGQARRSSRAWAPARSRRALPPLVEAVQRAGTARALGVRPDARQHAAHRERASRRAASTTSSREIESSVRRPPGARHAPRRRPLRAHRRGRHRVHRRRPHRGGPRHATTRALCDPRLNYRQALEMAFRLAKRMAALGR